MAANFLRLNYFAKLRWNKWKYGTKLCSRVNFSTSAIDKQCQYVNTNIISIRKASTSAENSSTRPLPFNSMPGPCGLKALPYIGTAFMFKPFSSFSPETFGKLINHMHDKYGAVFKSRLGRNYSVFTDSAQDAETVFRSEDAYPLRRNMILRKVFLKRNGLPNALGTVSGPEWQEIRRPLNPLLNRPQVCLHYLPAQNQVADDFVQRLQTLKFKPEKMSEEFFKFASESVGVVCFNQRLGFLNDDLSNSPDRLKLLEAFQTVLHCTFIDLLGLETRYKKTVDDPFYRTFEDSMKFIRRQSMIYVREVINELESRNIERSHNSKTENSIEIESNLLASLIVSSKLEMETILSIIDSMLIAGTDSTARNLAILFYNLALNPQVQANAAKEVIDLIGHDGPVVPETLTKLNYLKACVKESMRINFPLSNGTERILTSDAVISGYQVPKGTSVIMSSSRSSLNPKYFPDPLKFLPERWLREASGGDRTVEKKDSAAFAWLPFGHGARGCIGRRFAEMEMYVATAKVLQTLEINVDASYSGLDTIYTPFVTPKLPIPFIFTERRHVN